MVIKEIVIPVASTFEKRFADLVWEHCPELARQTAAGNMALSLDFASPDVQSTALTQLITGVVKELRPKVLKESEPLIEAAVKKVVERVCKGVNAEKNIPKRLDNQISEKLDQLIHSQLYEQVIAACGEYFGGRNGSFVRVIRARVDALVDAHLGRRLSTNPAAKQVLDSGLFEVCKEGE